MGLTQVNSAGIEDDSIVNADIKSDAAIALSKLASTPAVLTGSTNNTITTVTGANAIQGEASLTFDGSVLQVTPSSAAAEVRIGSGNASGAKLIFDGDSNGDFSGNDYSSIVHNSDGNLVIKANSPGTANCYIQVGSDGDYAAHFNEGGSSLLRYDNSTKIETIATGVNITGGVRLGGNNAVNELDDYEEGSWSPTLTQTAGVTLTNNEATYTKIGRQVNAYTYISWQGTPSSAGTAFRIGGLPFTAKSGNTYGSNTILFADDFTFTNLRPLVKSGDTYVYFHFSSGTANNANNGHMVPDTGNQYMILGLSYQV